MLVAQNSLGSVCPVPLTVRCTGHNGRRGACFYALSHHATRTLLKRVAKCVAGAHGNPRLCTEDPGAPNVADYSTLSTSTLVGRRFCLRAKRGTWTPPSTKKNASPSSRNRTSDQLISCIPLQSIALPTEKHSSFGRYVAHRKTMLGRMSLELARINRCLEKCKTNKLWY